MPNNYDIELTRTLQGGLQKALQYSMQTEQLQQQKAMQQADIDFKLMSHPNVPKKAKVLAYKRLRGSMVGNGLATDADMPDIDTWEDDYNAIAAQGHTVLQSVMSGQKDINTGTQELLGLLPKAQTPDEQKIIGTQLEQMKDFQKADTARNINEMGEIYGQAPEEDKPIVLNQMRGYDLKSATDFEKEQRAATEASEPKNDFQLFVKAKKAQGLTDNEISVLWNAQELERKKTGATRVTTNVNTKQETEEAKTVGKGFGEEYLKVIEAGRTAEGTIAKYDQLRNLLEKAGTGKIRPTTAAITALADSVGIKIDKNLPYAQAAEALSNQLALELRNPSGGAGMPGALSDKDREFLKASIPGIAQTPQGNKLMVNYAKKLAERNKDVARLAREYRKKKGSIDEGFYDELQKFSEANPLFSGKNKIGRFTVEVQ